MAACPFSPRGSSLETSLSNEDTTARTLRLCSNHVCCVFANLSNLPSELLASSLVIRLLSGAFGGNLSVGYLFEQGLHVKPL